MMYIRGDYKKGIYNKHFVSVYLAAVDISMIQNAVLELKIARIKCLQHAEFVRLLGDSPSTKEER